MAIIRGTEQADMLEGTDGVDIILGLGGDDTLYAYGDADELRGGLGNDTLHSMAGEASLWGEAGNDRLYAGYLDSADTVARAEARGGDGADYISAGAYEHILAHGDAGNDIIVAAPYSGSDIQGGAGNDTITIDAWSYDDLYYHKWQSISGGDGADTIRSNGRGILAHGDAGHDTIIASGDTDTLWGDAGNDTILAGGGGDWVRGGAGRDRITLGDGADRVVIGQGESGVGAAARDVITGFDASEDRVEIKLIDAHAGKAGDQAFAFIGSKAFTAAGQLHVTYADGDTIVSGNTDADRAPEFEIQLDGIVRLDAGDFVL